ncbi:nucleoside diphosphate kinase [Archaeoglobus sulfaticallidus PM70-1]|uniref:Nucleoside diphosphate kinase n=1 Tax=Archaeoglobus sulfaticallidus PM70-1 TaxID=387631 RepID=N0BIQ4_9EURY|nr:nucleoside-diphosphate kinase [Archaeoglobus sulfaticallidus]AGK62212.1 nucleoside diphosphate kinase [Archaeoglobus sulfaticallidus PM70-1]
MERTFVMIKPDGVERGVIGEVISRIERKGLKIVAMKMMRISEELAQKHYAEHKEKPFFGALISYITSSPVVAMVVEGKNAIRVVRTIVGATNPAEANPGTIRGDFGMDVGRNIIHASDSPESAKREINLFFSPEEILDYERAIDKWIYE